MTLGQKQRIFSKLIAHLVIWIYEQGYEVTFGDAYRDPRNNGIYGTKVGYSARYSLHKVRLAIDLNLFKSGEWLSKTEDHKFIGEKWESMHPSCTWGGRFKDGNHYSFRHGGRG